MSQNKLVVLASIICFCLGGQQLYADQLVTNGGFETGDFSGWTLGGFGATLPADYRVDAADAAAGNYGAYLTSEFGSLTLTQNLTVVPGDSYTVSFSLAETGYPGPTSPNEFVVTFAGQPVFSETSEPSQPYTNYSLLVTIPTSGGTMAPLDFALVNDIGYFSLDNVSVSTATPEPATFLLIAPVFAGLVLLRRRRS